eukprot:363887-Chlamydomonas_euryale.AAC.13
MATTVKRTWQLLPMEATALPALVSESDSELQGAGPRGYACGERSKTEGNWPQSRSQYSWSQGQRYRKRTHEGAGWTLSQSGRHSAQGPAGSRQGPATSQSHQPVSKQQLPQHRPIRHPGHTSEAREPRRVSDMHEMGHPRRAHLSCRVQGAIRPSAHAGDPAQLGIAGAD